MWQTIITSMVTQFFYRSSIVTKTSELEGFLDKLRTTQRIVNWGSECVFREQIEVSY